MLEVVYACLEFMHGFLFLKHPSTKEFIWIKPRSVIIFLVLSSLGNGGSSFKGMKWGVNSWPSFDLLALLMISKVKRGNSFCFDVRLRPTPHTTNNMHTWGMCDFRELWDSYVRISIGDAREKSSERHTIQSPVFQLPRKMWVTHYPTKMGRSLHHLQKSHKSNKCDLTS